MAEKPDNKPEKGAPSFKTDSSLEKTFLSILYQNDESEKETLSPEGEDALSAPLDLLPGEETADPGVTEPIVLPPEEPGTADEPSAVLIPDVSKPSDAPESAAGEALREAVPAPAASPETEEAPREKQAAPSLRKKGRRVLAVPGKKPVSAVSEEKAAPLPKSVPAPEAVTEPEIAAESAPAPEPIAEEKPAAKPIEEAEPVPAPVIAPEPEPVPEAAAVSAPEEPEESPLSAPFLRTSEKISSLAVDLYIAALPILGVRIWHYGWRTVTVLLTALLACLFSELAFALISRKDPPSALKDRNFAVTALTVTLISSPNLPLWAIAALCGLAVILFRGVLGLRTSSVRSHPLNPAMAAFSLLLLLWNGLDRFGAIPGVRAPLLLASPDPAAYGVGNPILASLREGVLPSDSLVSLIFGNAAGLLPVLFVLIALVYLLVRKAVPWQVPAAMLLSGVLFAALLPRTAVRTDMILLQTVLFETCSGTFLLCALFCGADTATVPYSGTGKIVFGFLAGTFTLLLRHYTGIVNCAPIGVVAANALTPLINRFTVPRPFGGK
ncbi:MAG: RnfABCDGE type electron transport complex subunit D [Lachnospiraceae bacterium]|nr:RnfABCDGE type electron transport complex subunit D [Lachnospiraceae bacterium]